jgi:hypothetical protein
LLKKHQDFKIDISDIKDNKKFILKEDSIIKMAIKNKDLIIIKDFRKIRNFNIWVRMKAQNC